jgi:hypothetical protein
MLCAGGVCRAGNFEGTEKINFYFYFFETQDVRKVYYISGKKKGGK